MPGRWTRDETLASGQVFEFRVWAALTEQSRGQLYVFLPLTDRGIDALVHRSTDGSQVGRRRRRRSRSVNVEPAGAIETTHDGPCNRDQEAS
jgi:hypothetical protein